MSIVWLNIFNISALIEDLEGYKDLRKELIEGVFDLKAALSIADYTLKLHKRSHKCHLSADEFSKMIEDFRYYITILPL